MIFTTPALHANLVLEKGLGPVTTMIICVCQRINDRDLQLAVAAGAADCGDVFRFRGATPQCGQCLELMQQMLEEADLLNSLPVSAAAE
jgi:bacterioferritin-associated ferredoxin